MNTKKSATKYIYQIFHIFVLFSNITYAQVHWTQRNPLEMDLFSVIWAGNQFVSVGSCVIVSPDGNNWTIVKNSPSDLYSVVWTGTQLVTVGDSGIFTSPDGFSWEKRCSVIKLSSIAWTGQQLVAVGRNGDILTSPDGITWTNRASSTSPGMGSITWTGKELIAISGGINYSLILTSRDGIEWSSFKGSTYPITFITVKDTAVIMGGGLNSTLFYQSLRATKGTGPSGYGHYVSGTWSGTLMVAVGPSGSIATSLDGVNWTNREIETTVNLTSVTWNGNTFVAVGRRGFILTSTDGITWATKGSASQADLDDIIRGNNQIVATGNFRAMSNSTVGSIFSSPDGINWTNNTISKKMLCVFDLTWTDSQYVLIGNSSADNSDSIYTSKDAVRWEPVEIKYPDLKLRAVAGSGKKIVVAGYDNNKECCVILTSSDAKTWTEAVPGQYIQIFDMIWTGAKFIAVGYESEYFGTILTSSDGVSWSKITSKTKGILYGAVSNGNKIVAVGDSGSIFLSDNNGVTWEKQNSGCTFGISSVTWTGKQFVAVVGHDNYGLGTVLTSQNGTEWKIHESGYGRLRSVLWTDSLLVAVGYGGLIITSPEEISSLNRKHSGSELISQNSKPLIIMLTSKNMVIKMPSVTSPGLYTFGIYNAIGKCIQTICRYSGRYVVLPIDNVSPGSYVLKIEKDDFCTSHLFVKKN